MRDNALDKFRSQAKRAKPTKQHRAAIWECMLATIYAMNAKGVVKYFDYDYAAAVAHVGPVEDVRVARYRSFDMHLGVNRAEDYQVPREGQLVWFVKDK